MIPGLDGLRAIACLLVLGGHTSMYSFGWMGVQLFFVISGFLITGILLRMKESLPAKQYFYKFYGRRILRIFPLYFFYLFILSVAIWQSEWISWDVLRNELQNIVGPQLPHAYLYLYNFFYTTSDIPDTRFLNHFWSLSVEEQFYIIWPLVLFLTPKKNLKKLFLFTIALAPFLRLFIYLLYNGQIFPSFSDDPYVAVYLLPFSHLDAFAMGAYISCFKLPHPRKQLAVMIYVVPILGFLSQYLTTGAIQVDSAGYEYALFTGYKFMWGYSLLNYLFTLIIYSVVETKLFTRLLDHFILDSLGKISYGLYVYHFPVIWFLLALQLKYREQLPFSLYLGDVRTYFVVLILTTLVASLSFHLLEKPINNLKDKFFSLKPGRTQSSMVPAQEAEGLTASLTPPAAPSVPQSQPQPPGNPH